MTPAVLLAKGIDEMGLDVSIAAQTKLLDYLVMLQKWNKVYNLTAVRAPLEMVTLHLLDSLSVLPYIQTNNLLDVGSGAGLPGIVLAICKPDLQVTTIDTVQKKAIFMRQVKGALGLNNLTVVHARVEAYQSAEKFDAIISRAFSEIALFVQLTRHLLAGSGKWLAMKGQILSQELTVAEDSNLPIRLNKIVPLNVAGLDAKRHLIIFENSCF